MTEDKNMQTRIFLNEEYLPGCWNKEKTMPGSGKDVEYILKSEAMKLRNSLKIAIGLCEECGDFRNGNTHNGIDEGQVMADRMINGFREAIAAFDEVMG